MGQILKDKYYSIACPKVQNQNLINFIIKLKNIYKIFMIKFLI